MEDTALNKSLVEQTLSFHGLPLIKTWNDENGPSLISLGIQQNAIDCTLYHERLKNFNYTDRAKRLRLHQFICSKSATLFRNYANDSSEKKIQRLLVGGGEQIPPMEYFSNFNHDERTTKFFMNLKPGDVAYGLVLQLMKNGLLVKILCTTGSSCCLISDLNIKGLVLPQSLILAQDSKNDARSFLANDYVCCEVLQISESFPPIILGMTGIHERFDNGPPLGLISTHEMPQFYKIAIDQQNQGKTYNQILKDSEAFNNPSAIDNLYSELGLEKNSYYSFMSKNKFPQDEYAKDLRQQQVSKIAFKSVAEGIGHFKEGRHEEAFQCLNKALSIDPRNVEGLVARGALNANSGRFQKAIVDFETALKFNPNHMNAKKYLGETLLALGRSLEEENKFEEAQKAYIECLNVNPHHQEALASLNYIKTKINARKIVEPAELELPPLNLGGSTLTIKNTKSIKDESRSKKVKKEKKKRGKKRRGSSSDSSSETSESSESSSESTDNSSSSSDSESRSKKRNKKRKSVSPIKPETDMRYGQYAQSSSFDPMDEHEIKVKKFLEMSRDEDDYEEKVGQLIAEASKYQKSKQVEEAKGSKKKKKSEKKLKKDKKKRKKEDKKKGKEPDIDDIREALKMFENLPDKIKKLYQEKIKDDESKHKRKDSADNNMSEEGKWKMKFSKTESDAKPKKANNFNLYDSEEDEQTRNQVRNAAPSQIVIPYGVTSTMTKAPSPKPEVIVAAPPLIANQGAVVLDKFGNFRRVAVEPTVVQNISSDTRRSRSKGRRSRSDSRSPRRHRSRSWRRNSHSRSRSFSRSPVRGTRGGGHRSRPRYSPPSRGRPAYRGRFRDTRDFRNNDYRDRRIQFGGRGRFGGGRFDRRSFSRSPEPRNRLSRSPDRKEH